MEFDLLIKNGRIVDGTGNPWYHADLGLRDGHIEAIGRLEGASAARQLDAAGNVVAPGFIDIHSHADFILPLKRHPEILGPFLRQGITTVVTGNCGYSTAPVNRDTLELLKAYTSFVKAEELPWSWRTMGEYFRVLDEQGIALNAIPLVAHGATRVAVMGFEGRAPSEEELARMKALVRQAMEEGANGLSSGLIYAPGMFSTTEELVELAKEVAPFDGIYTSHVRGSSETLLSAVKELIRVGEEAGVRVQHSHMEAFGRANWPKIEQALELHDEARSRGLDIGFDVIPYIAANTTLLASFPPWSLDGGVSKLIERLKDPTTRRRIKRDVEEMVPGWPPWLPGSWPHNLVGATGWDNIWAIWVDSEKNKPLEGRSFAQLGREMGKDPFDVAADLAIEEQGKVMALYFGVSGDLEGEDGLRRLLVHPRGSINTDAILIGKGLPHPAAYGSFPRVLGHYVRELRLMTLEDAVRKMTSLSAQRFGLRDRALLREGAWADITIFNPDTVADRATYLEPQRYPEGIEYVLVNGRVVVEKGVHHPELLAGRVLRRR